MKRAEEGDHARTPRVNSRQLQCRLDRFGTAIGEKHSFRRWTGRGLSQALRKIDLRLIVKIGPGHVDKFGSLILNGSDNFGMTMARGSHRDASREVQKAVAIDILDDRSTALVDN